jgi:hypothetical protein
MYTVTKFTHKLKRSETEISTVIYLPSEWELDADKEYFITIRRVTDPPSREIRLPKKITPVGKSFRLVIDKKFGIEPGEIVTVSVNMDDHYDFGDDDTDSEEEDDDSGVES